MLNCRYWKIYDVECGEHNAVYFSCDEYGYDNAVSFYMEHFASSPILLGDELIVEIYSST